MRLPILATALVTCFTVSASDHPSAQTPPAISVHHDPVVGVTTEQVVLRIGDEAGVALTLTTAYGGTDRPRPVKRVELAFSRDAARTEGANYLDTRLVVDGERFERRGTLNIRQADRSSDAAVAMVFDGTVASRLAFATSVEGHVLGYDFALAPEQLASVEEVLRQWTIAERSQQNDIGVVRGRGGSPPCARTQRGRRDRLGGLARRLQLHRLCHRPLSHRCRPRGRRT